LTQGDPAHAQGKTPGDAAEVFKGAVKDPRKGSGMGNTWWAKAKDGSYYRYQGQNNEVHWNGSFSPQDARVPSAVRTLLK
jgi:hypothetical protein